MEFRLIYEGPLPAQGSGGGRAKEKHQIRKQLHPQLAELWQQHPVLRSLKEQVNPLDKSSYVDYVASQYTRLGYRFVPLVWRQPDNVATCELDILFLRRDNPGGILVSGGDIDNRIKVLFDGLKTPKVVEDLGGFNTPDAGEDPFFCLVEDDSLVTRVNIMTDRLLLPMTPPGNPHDVVLIIRVNARLVDADEFYS